MPQFDVFISHNSVDKRWVIRLKDDLQRYGVSVWLDKDEIRPGDLFAKALEEGLTDSGAVALIVSPEAMASGWVQTEYYRALSLAQNKRLQLIPVILRDADLPDFLEDRNWVDFREESAYSQSVWKLVWGITGKKPDQVLDLTSSDMASAASVGYSKQTEALTANTATPSSLPGKSQRALFLEEQETNLGNKTEATKTALWIQIVVTFGAIAVAAIGAWQAVRIAQIGKETPAPVATATLNNTVVNTSAPTPVTPIQRIDFDYQDSPTKHGWMLLESEADETQLVIQHISDQFVENAISISSPVRYAMEFEVELAAAQLGRVVEFVANLNKNAAFFAYVSLERDDGSTTSGWLKLTIGKGQPEPIDQDEWRLFIEPVSTKGGDWLLYRVDLQDAVMKTFGNDGWKFQQLEKIRIRGDLSLDYIHIFERQP